MIRSLFLASVAAAFTATAGQAADTVKAIYTFSGSAPTAGLIIDAADDLFGTTSGAQPSLFEVTPTGAFTTIATLRPGRANVVSALTADAAGNLFGTVSATAANGGGGYVFRLSAAGALTTVHTFTSSDVLFSGVTLDAAGNLFGTTSGQDAKTESIFRLTQRGAVSTVATLQGSALGNVSAAVPTSGLAFAHVASGATDLGTLLGTDNQVFSLTRQGVLALDPGLSGLYSGVFYTGANNQKYSVFNSFNKIGMFALNTLQIPTASSQARFDFGSNAQGFGYDQPNATVVLYNGTRGILYTSSTRSDYGYGSIFVENDVGSISRTFSFSNSRATGIGSPVGGLVLDSVGNVFGITADDNGAGTLYEDTSYALALSSSSQSLFSRASRSSLPTGPSTVPEPASWLFMILGFGLVGAAGRGRRVGRALALRSGSASVAAAK